MMKTSSYLILTLSFCCLSNLAFSQFTSRSVIGSAGSVYDNLQFGELHFTLGEVAANSLDNGISIAEGFHQTYSTIFISFTKQTAEDKITVYPNPTVNYLNIEFPENTRGSLSLLDESGRTILNKSFDSQNELLDFEMLAAGTYTLQISALDGRKSVHRIVKIKR